MTNAPQKLFRTIGLSSDALIMRGQSVFEVQSDHVIMRTPNEPDYWHGNLVAVRVMGDPRQDLACFMEAFPDASHVTVVWDVPGLDPEPLRTALPELEIGTFDVLTLQGAIGDAALPLGINLQPVNDWDGLLDLQLEAASEVGYDPAAHKHYLQRRNAGLRAQIAAGNGQCFGAYDGDFIVGTMGIFHDDRIARYQSVITRASYRRRGSAQRFWCIPAIGCIFRHPTLFQLLLQRLTELQGACIAGWDLP